MTAADRWVVGAALALVASLYVWSWGGPSPAPGVLMTAALVFGSSGGIIARAMVGGVDRAKA
jgi:hypothetical protein